MISVRTPRPQRVRRLAHLLAYLCLFIGSSTFGAAPRAISAAASQASARVGSHASVVMPSLARRCAF